MDNYIFEKAYNKLKSSVYYDKTQLILRNKIVEFEDEYDIDLHLDKLCHDFIGSYDTLKNNITETISFSAFPKKLEKSNTAGVILNKPIDKINITDNQYFIDMCVEGHILGVVWLMEIGYKLDKNIYEKSYGNRIRKKLINELSDKPTYSPYLFEPYFMQYESWRDAALDEAKKYLGLKNDVMILTMDLKRYFYSVDVTKEAFDQMFIEAGIDSNDTDYENLKNLNDLMAEIVSTYALKFGNEFEGRNILPIGFLPSNVISNWCLRNFDNAIVNGWNPIFYGRYVDDILIVDKIEHNSKIYEMIRKEPEKVNVDYMMAYYTENCCKWSEPSEKGPICGGLFFECDENGQPLLKEQNNVNNDDKNEIIYRVNYKFNPMKSDYKSKLIVQNEKMKLFYFFKGETDALIDCFKNQISKNKSEFRHMPEDDAFYDCEKLNEIYSLDIGDGINKFREIKGFTLDKFGLSKFLGKHLRIAGMVSGYNKSKFEQDIDKIFTPNVIIEYYIFWERIIETLVINENFSAVLSFVKKIISAISNLNCKDKSECKDWIDRTSDIKESLYNYLYSALIRSYSLVWKYEASNSFDEILNTIAENSFEFENKLKNNDFKTFCLQYCRFRMIDKSVLPIPVDMLLSDNSTNIFSKGINITRFKDALESIDDTVERKMIRDYYNYKYYPYIVGINEISIVACLIKIFDLSSNNCQSNTLKSDYFTDEHFEVFSDINFTKLQDENKDKNKNKNNIIKVENHTLKSQEIKTIFVGNGKKSKIRIAVANAFLYYDNVIELYNGKPQRNYKRYQGLSKIVNQAINEHADILVLPEAYVPFEWLAMLSKTCERNKLAIVCGVEYLIKHNRNTPKSKVFNLTAVILPFEDENYSGTNISFHLKKHYAPIEKSIADPRGLELIEGNQYELYRWNDFYFAVYCCYELASITDRALFQSYADAIIAIEWNKDVNYYSNILESLSRDIHCYCIQVNSADYGDSRITGPSPTVTKDIVRTKGGKNDTILVGEIDVSELRRFQLMGEMGFGHNNKFKPTPPNFMTDVVEDKYNHRPFKFKNE